MPKLRYTHAARDDLVRIFEFVARESGSARTAKQFVGKLRRRCSSIAALDVVAGRVRPELGHDLRSVAEGNYVIFLRYEGDVLKIVAIIEGHRDIEALAQRRKLED